MAKRSKLSDTEPVLSAFGDAVREIRKKQNISQEALADLAEMDRSYLGGVERGEHNIALVNIQRIADALEISIAQLMQKAKL